MSSRVVADDATDSFLEMQRALQAEIARIPDASKRAHCERLVVAAVTQIGLAQGRGEPLVRVKRSPDALTPSVVPAAQAAAWLAGQSAAVRHDHEVD